MDYSRKSIQIIRRKAKEKRGKMSVEFWKNAERFYESGIVILSVIIVIILAIIVVAATSAKKENRVKIVMGLLISAVALGVIGYVGHLRYQPYIAQAGYVNALMRDRTPSFRGYNYYGRTELITYSQFNDLESLRELDIYEEKEATEPVVYLGQGDYFHYFEHEDGRLTKRLQAVRFSEEADQAQFVGSLFTLKDDGFKDIGFVNPEHIMFREIVIPASEEGKVYQPEDDYIIPKPEERMNNWNF